MPGVPTYEYHCDSCDKNFDVVQSFHDEALSACPTCGSPVRKVFGNVGIVFKGSGFYKTDSRNGGPAKPAAGDGAAKQGSEGSGAESSGSEGSGSDSSGASSDSPTAKPSGDGSTGGSSSESKSSPAPAASPAKATPSPSSP